LMDAERSDACRSAMEADCGSTYNLAFVSKIT
jgi:hypothetical protein